MARGEREALQGGVGSKAWSGGAGSGMCAGPMGLRRIWGRLSLRAQAVIAVLAPCVAVAGFSSVYFPYRQNEQAERALEAEAKSLGALAAAAVAPTLRLIEDGLLGPDELDAVFEGIAAGGKSVFAAVLASNGERVVRKRGDLPGTRFLEPASGCEVDPGPTLVVRCSTRALGADGLLVAGFSKAEAQAAASRNRLTGVWSLVVAVLGGLLLAALLSGALVVPVRQVTRAAQEVAAGDISVAPLEVSAAAEIRSMASSFNDMLLHLRTVVTQMVSLTGRLSGASLGLMGAAEEHEKVSAHQASYAEQIGAAFEELTRTAEQISRSAEVVEESARKTQSFVMEARGVVEEVITSTASIRAESKDLADAVIRLNKELNEVATISRTINAIAARSDVLALNAALEGTRAGEVGRGFSKVAGEMRRLAEMVGESSRNIGGIVERVQESSSTAVKRAHSGLSASDRGVEVADRASKAFREIEEVAASTSRAALQISVASKQQKVSSEEAVQGARNVANLVNDGVAATQRSSHIAQDLKGVATALADVTRKFRVSGPGPA